MCGHGGQSVSAHPKVEENLSISETLHTIGPDKQVFRVNL